MRKEELRKRYKNQRQGLSSALVHEYSLAIAEQFLLWPRPQGIVLAYSAIVHQKEVNPKFIVERLQTQNTKVALPVVEPQSKDLKVMLVNQETKYTINTWGIAEPFNGQILEPSKIAVVLVPLLVCDHYGHRVGYGGGYYDRLLAKCSKSCWKVGLSFFNPIPKIEDINANDFPLDALITPEKTYAFSSRAKSFF